MQTVKILCSDESQSEKTNINLSILKLIMGHEEGKSPYVLLYFPAHQEGELAPLQQKVLEVFNGECKLFCGRLSEEPFMLDGYMAAKRLEILWEEETQKGLQSQIEKMMTEDAVDPLLYDLDRVKKEATLLADLNRHLFYSPLGKSPQILPQYTGGRVVDLGGHYEADSLHVWQEVTPFTHVRVRLTASWVQYGNGRTDISQRVAFFWPNGVIQTFDPEGLQRRWFKTGRLKGGTYELLESALVPEAAEEETLQLSEDVQVCTQTFRARMVVGWSFEQKREEICTFELRAPQSPKAEGNVLELDLELGDIQADLKTPLWLPARPYQKGDLVLYQGVCYRCGEDHISKNFFQEDLEKWKKQAETQAALRRRDGGSYFTTPRGQESLTFALKLARCRLEKSLFGGHVQFRCALAQGLALDPDTWVVLKDERFPAGRLLGKVKKVVHTLDGMTGRFESEVTLAYAPDALSKDLKQESDGRWRLSVLPSYALGDIQDQIPRLGFLQGRALTASQIVARVTSTQFADEQREALLSNPPSTWSALKQRLRLLETSVRIELADLQRRETLTHEIQVPVKIR